MSSSRTQAVRIIGLVLALAVSVGVGLWLFVHWTLYYLLLCAPLFFLPILAYRGSRFARLCLAVVAVGFVAGGLIGLKLSS